MGDPLDRHDVQGIIPQSYLYPISRHFLFSFSDKQGTAKFLAHWDGRITTAAENLDNFPEPLINVGFTWQGLIKAGAFDNIGGVDAANRAFLWDFKTGPHPRSLGAIGENSPEQWWNAKFAGKDIDLLVHVFCKTEAALTNITDEIRRFAPVNGVRELIPTRDSEAITGRQIEGRKLHFGYEDGISHPPVNWDDDPDKTDLIYHRGSFLLGESVEYPQSFPRREDGPLFDFVRNGSYMAFVWIYQDVAAFNHFLREYGPKIAPNAPSPEEAQELLAAKLMGRWRNGSPLILAPRRPDRSLSTANNFGYASDPRGEECPLTAHIRIANRRDEELTFPNQNIQAGFPRLLRRGTPYGPPLNPPNGDVDDGVDRGTVGLFFCANIDQQFYTITR